MKKTLTETTVGLIIAFVGLGMLLAFYMFNLDMRWIGALIIFILGFIIFQQIYDKEIFLLHFMIFLLPFTGGFLFSILTRTDLIFAFDVFLFTLIAWWLLETHAFQRGGLYIHRSTIPAFLMVLWAATGIVLAVSKMSTFYGVYFLVKVFLFYFFVINKIVTIRQLRIIINMLMLGLGIQGFLGLLQKLVGHGLGLGFFGETNRNYVSSLSRVRGTLGAPNQYGAYIILLLPIAASLYISAKKKKEKLWYGGIIALALSGLFLSLSRSSWFGTIGAIAVMTIILQRKKQLNPKIFRGLLVVTIVILGIAIVFWNTIALRFETGEQGRYRSLMVRMAIQMIMSHPILGVGLFNYQYHSFSSFKFWHPVHNTILRLAAETGIPGLIFFLWFVVIILKEAYRNLSLKDPYLRKITLGVIGGYTAFIIAIQFGPEYQHYRQKFIFWLLAAITVASKRIAKNELKIKRKAHPKTGSNQMRNINILK